MTLNVLSLQWISSSVGEGREVEVLVDGVNLIDLARNWEAARTSEPKLAGAYAGVQHWEADFLEHWLSPTPERVNLLECGCGVWGCWPLQALVIHEGGRVVWTDFEQPHRRGKWSYDGFGPFVFECGQYEAQVKALLEDKQGQ